jgi:hypothetical protein
MTKKQKRALVIHLVQADKNIMLILEDVVLKLTMHISANPVACMDFINILVLVAGI